MQPSTDIDWKSQAMGELLNLHVQLVIGCHREIESWKPVRFFTWPKVVWLCVGC